jgi:hypothetical protein
MDRLVDVISEIKKRLLPEQLSRATIGDSTVTVAAARPNGFGIHIEIESDETTVSFEMWHEHFTDPNEAIECFVFGLNSPCRLKNIMYGATCSSCTLETLQNGEWVKQGVTGALFFPFWRKRRVEYLQNVDF